MRDRLLIYSGLAVFLLLVTFPVWHGLAAKTPAAAPDVRRPAGQTACVATRPYMRKAHMALLMEWRDAKVRRQQREYTAPDGKVYRVSLAGTCLTQCHGSREQFCDRCHTFAGVAVPDCWKCHTSPPAVPAGAITAAAGGVR